ncbi:hypothetical protein LA635_3297 [Erwinia amylovora LA635]|nr:hypothetical protein LA635_3297 [Erwinia amylovora LA635]CDK20289.1 hypothetical protein LA636_3297 [Erwinia amylovora LA636]CDK23660.1 hypothetical protein LA637_3300 [Erwinia amylovora LA637]
MRARLPGRRYDRLKSTLRAAAHFAQQAARADTLLVIPPVNGYTDAHFYNDSYRVRNQHAKV